MPDDAPLYRFKQRNYDMSLYLESRRYAADQLRRDAEILIERAKQIDEERHELERSLLPVAEGDDA